VGYVEIVFHKERENMTRQNRVNPFGELIAVPAHGTMMGNRGILHDDHGKLTDKRWTHPHWVACRLEFNGRRQEINAPGSYTQLFFLDEATALAAGHRPCYECRRDAYQRFRDAWLRGNTVSGFDASPGFRAIDKYVHNERVTRNREQVTFTARLKELPDGTFIALHDKTDEAYLVWQGKIQLWRPDGYDQELSINGDEIVTVLTLRSFVRALTMGYIPEVFLANYGK
jgi:hypothetical protein